ncbi:MAG: hypothetical protein A3F11_06900 [Gammaproteobacteria bacterium RIFCSPHIGHO2_12_FULL_37_14]|nr:MAG: hypothetical protein A3F11_06900 [Gammaproteobacteria bacterium RIFCSPHIGHO2_12_FULL_37_14]
MADIIENFFAQWFQASQYHLDIDTLSHLYTLLLTKEFQDKITLSDEIIQGFIQLGGEDPYRDITPYQINRIFLHAILHDPQDWSPLFANTLQEIYAFVKNNFNQINAANAALLKQDSYPKALMEQLRYLYQCYSPPVNMDNRRPLQMILLPHQIKKAREWYRISSYLQTNDEKRDAVYQPLSAYINRLLYENDFDCFPFPIPSLILSNNLLSLPRNRRLAFIRLPQIKLNEIIIDSIDLLKNLIHFPEVDRLAFLTHFKNDYIQLLVSNTQALKSILTLLPEENRYDFVVKVIGINHFNKITIDLAIISLFPDKLIIIQHWIDSVKQLNDFLALHIIANRLPVILTLMDHIKTKTIIKNLENLRTILENLSIRDRMPFINKLGKEFFNKILSDSDLPKIEYDRIVKILLPQHKEEFFANYPYLSSLKRKKLFSPDDAPLTVFSCQKGIEEREKDEEELIRKKKYSK